MAIWGHPYASLTRKELPMNGLTDYITQQPWEDTITAWYVLVDDAYQRLIAR